MHIDKQEVIELHELGYNVKNISRILGYPLNVVYDIIRKHIQ